jgi:hypothetical protein
MKRKNGFGIIIAETRGSCVTVIIWLGQKGGPRSKMGSKDNRSGLANRPLRGRLRPGLAMYLDRYVCLK